MGISGFPTKPVGSPDQPDFFICLLISGEAIPNNSYVQFAQSNVTSGNADEIFKKLVNLLIINCFCEFLVDKKFELRSRVASQN